MDKTYGFLIGR